MAREILFRGKRTDNGELVEGNLIIYPKTKRTKIMVWEWADLEFNAIEVRSETVGQYTGLTDKNGNRIFEGDIIKLSQSGKCYEVKYKSGCFCIGINWAISHEPDCEVIGNIHDNPELLNGTES